MYLDYWNLQKAPFDNVPDSSMYADCHESMEKVIAETIFGIKQADEDFVVIIGAVGSGKTLALKVIIDSLETDKYKPVLITSPSIPFAQLLKEIISQITGEPCAENRKVHLLQTFHRLLFKTMEKGQKIVIFIDEADSLSPANLDNLRLLTSMQDDQRNLFTLVLAGQTQLARRLEHPKRENLFQRIGIYGRIDKLPSPEAVKKYVETRLHLAGTQKMIFPTESIRAIWDNSGEGVPRLVNRICKLCLIEAAGGGLTQVSAELVSQAAQRFKKLGEAAIQRRKPRCAPDDFEISDVVEMTEEVIEMISAQSIADNKKKPVEDETTVDATESGDAGQTPFAAQETETPVGFEPPPAPLLTQGADARKSLPATVDDAEITAALELSPESLARREDDAEGVMETEAAAETKTAEEELPSVDKKSSSDGEIKSDEITIGGHTILLDIPKEILERVKSFNRESVLKSAGFWAAKILKSNPQLTSSPQADPVRIWNEIKDSILQRLSM
jgi:type II secretory pathway predicted ATPase ExeA